MKQPTATIVGKFFNIVKGDSEAKALCFVSPEGENQLLLSLDALCEIWEIGMNLLKEIGDSIQKETKTGFVRGEKLSPDLIEFTFERKDGADCLNKTLVLSQKNIEELLNYAESPRHKFIKSGSDEVQMGLCLNLTDEEFEAQTATA